MKYQVSFTVKGENSTTNGVESRDFTGTVSFEKGYSFEYGNGYSMFIEMPDEPFGEQGYDIRYDRTFRPDNGIGYIVRHYTDKYDGKDGAWALTRICVSAV